MILKSKEYCSSNSSVYEGLFSHDRGTETIVINDTMINDSVVATARAKAELIENAYDERIVVIRSVHIAGLKQNDIINFNGFLWIIKEISYEINFPKVIQSIKGIRYE